MPDRALAIAALTRADLGELLALHECIVADLENGAYLHARKRGFFADLLGGGGRIAGARADGRLVGYAAFQFPRGRAQSYARKAGISDRKLPRIAEGAGMGIAPQMRGSSIFGGLVEARLALAREAACDWFLGVIWRYNFANLAPHLRRGYFGTGLIRDIDGMNIMLARPLSGWRQQHPAPVLQRSVHDDRGLSSALAHGHMITACIRTGTYAHFILSPADPRLAELR